MKIYISADMEGVTGVTHSQDVIRAVRSTSASRGS